MTISMPSLTRAPNGDHFARKVIPADVRDAYATAFGVRQEARFRLRGDAPEAEAKRAWAEWLAEVEGRIGRLRAAASGSPVALSKRELHDLAGRWYVWFVARHRDEPGSKDRWELASDEMRHLWEQARGGIGRPEEYDDFGDHEEQPISDRHRRAIQAKLTELAELPSFLASEGSTLVPAAMDVLLDDVLPREFRAALVTLMRLSDGVAEHDARETRGPLPAPAAPAPQRRQAGMRGRRSRHTLRSESPQTPRSTAGAPSSSTSTTTSRRKTLPSTPAMMRWHGRTR